MRFVLVFVSTGATPDQKHYRHDADALISRSTKTGEHAGVGYLGLAALYNHAWQANERRE
jgi:hypothetical protein